MEQLPQACKATDKALDQSAVIQLIKCTRRKTERDALKTWRSLVVAKISPSQMANNLIFVSCLYFASAQNVHGELTLLPKSMGAACLDGSQYGELLRELSNTNKKHDLTPTFSNAPGFYFTKSTSGSTKWTISIEGGGWCYNEELCFERSKSAS